TTGRGAGGGDLFRTTHRTTDHGRQFVAVAGADCRRADRRTENRAGHIRRSRSLASYPGSRCPGAGRGGLMAAVIDARSREIEEQRERALRAILARPLMTADHRLFHLLRIHAEYLRDWLARECGWVLRIELDYARLLKGPADI